MPISLIDPSASAEMMSDDRQTDYGVASSITSFIDMSDTALPWALHGNGDQKQNDCENQPLPNVKHSPIQAASRLPTS